MEDWVLEAVVEGLATRVGPEGEGVEDNDAVTEPHTVAEVHAEEDGVIDAVTVTVPLEEGDTEVVTVGVVG